ncbi:NAD+ synthase [Halobaculum sp. P14]|uniref:NAD+ synthase n=1 Tax=Halobaculum sp. P14 TaxID=3421638 RepID=UPI003EB6F219
MSRPAAAGERFATDAAEVASLRDHLTAFVAEYVDGAGATEVVVNMSGGVDSTVAATLAVEALGEENVYGLLLPCNLGTAAEQQDALVVAESLGIEYSTLQLQPLLNQFLDQISSEVETRGERIALGNVTARFRMVCAYFVANVRSSLVLGTTNRTEWLLGYFTKHGDGGTDFLPLGDLYKVEVRALARELGVPDDIVEKPATAGLWAGQTDRDELGVEYDTVDRVLRALVDREWSVDRVAAELAVDHDTVADIVATVRQTRHKRRPKPTPSSGPVADRSMPSHRR